mmetsp:Transcript_1001/g.1588  ORF Transcript_1001/g.1588 Transcript_1001/m.1588 type:complete len:338 (+) Transcript_1001:127-1140(+)
MTPTFSFLFAFLLVFLKIFDGTAAESDVDVIASTARTGSWQNCTETPNLASNEDDHLDSAHTIVSCTEIHYRIPQASLDGIDNSVLIGVLSGAMLKNRRDYIRSTWAYKRRNVFFIVGGMWDEIEDEYSNHGDILWLDKEEVYITETSVLTFKTESFLSIMYERIMKTDLQIEYLFKADDDSYVNLHRLNQVLAQTNLAAPVHYWGQCHSGRKPHRDQVIPWQKKWYISHEIYPEPEYPPYCLGAGYAISRHFLDCAIDQGHAAKVRYMPNEDVAVGLLAERCGIPIVSDDRVSIRWDEEDGISMEGKIVQHYIKTEKEMRLHHKSATGVMGPLIAD